MPTNSLAVIDKSALQGLSPRELASHCERYHIVATNPLFKELITANEKERKMCFAKLNACQQALRIGGAVGVSLGFELDNHKPAEFKQTLIAENARFNPRLADGILDFGDAFAAFLSEAKESETSDAHSFRDGSPVVARWFPDIFNVKDDTDRRRRCDAHKITVPGNAPLVRRVYEDFRNPEWPPAAAISSEWTIYRWTEVRILWSLDFVSKYGGQSVQEASSWSSDIYDEEICLLALLAGNLIALDKDLVKNFSLLSRS